MRCFGRLQINMDCILALGLGELKQSWPHSDALGKSWKECYRDGDRAIKVKVIPLKKEAKK